MIQGRSGNGWTCGFGGNAGRRARLAAWLVMVLLSAGTWVTPGRAADDPFRGWNAGWLAMLAGRVPASPDRVAALEKQTAAAGDEVLRRPAFWLGEFQAGLRLAPPAREALARRVDFAMVQEGRRDLGPLRDFLRRPAGVAPPSRDGGPASPVGAAPRVISLARGFARSLTGVSADGGTFRFAVARETGRSFPPFRRGDLLVGGEDERFPDGFLKQVTAVETRGDGLVVTTEPVGFEDLVAGSAGFRRELGPEDVDEVTVGPGAARPEGRNRPGRDPGSRDGDPVVGTVRLLQPPSGRPPHPAPPGPPGSGHPPHPGAPGQPGHPGPPVTPPTGHGDDLSGEPEEGSPPASGTWWEKAKRHAIFSSGVALAFQVKGVDCALQVRLLHPELTITREEIGFRGQLVAVTSVGIWPAKDLAFKTNLLTLRLHPVPLGFWGPVPLYVRPVLKLSIRGRLTGSVGVGGGVSWVAPISVRIRKENGVWRHVSESQVKAEVSGFRFDGTVGSLDAKIAMGPSLSLFVDDLAGPTLRGQVFLAFQALATLVKTGSPRPVPVMSLFSVKAGAEALVGGALQFFRNAEFLATVVRVDTPLYRLRFSGIDLDPARLTLDAGSVLDPAAVTIWPLYQERVQGEDRARKRLSFRLRGDLGEWEPSPGPDGRLAVPATAGESVFRCRLPLLDEDLPAAAADLPVIIRP